MIAKLITYGKDRNEALERVRRSNMRMGMGMCVCTGCILLTWLHLRRVFIYVSFMLCMSYPARCVSLSMLTSFAVSHIMSTSCGTFRVHQALSNHVMSCHVVCHVSCHVSLHRPDHRAVVRDVMLLMLLMLMICHAAPIMLLVHSVITLDSSKVHSPQHSFQRSIPRDIMEQHYPCRRR